jgi:hypothetical protein
VDGRTQIVNIGHCRQKLSQAIRALALGQGTIQQRLSGAYLELLGLTHDEFPDDVQEEFKDVKDNGLDQLSGDKLLELPPQDAVNFAKKLFDLYLKVQRPPA